MTCACVCVCMGYAHNFIITMEKKYCAFQINIVNMRPTDGIVSGGDGWLLCVCLCLCGLISTLQAIKYNSFFLFKQKPRNVNENMDGEKKNRGNNIVLILYRL